MSDLTRADLDEAVSTLRGDIAALAALQEAVSTLRSDVDKLQGVDVEPLRADVHALQEAVARIEAFVNGDPPLQKRLEELEQNVARFKQSQGVTDDSIRAGAGTAGDPQHRETIRDESGKLVDAAEGRQQIVNVGVRERLTLVERFVAELQNANLKLLAVISLILAVIIAVGWNVLHG